MLDPFIKEGSKENFHEYLRSVTNIISKNLYRDKDNTFKLLKRLRKNENIEVISSDKESSTAILNKTDYRHFYITKYDDGMRPVSNQPARFFATPKTHKFDTIEYINVKDLKLSSTIDQTGTYIYDAPKSSCTVF